MIHITEKAAERVRELIKKNNMPDTAGVKMGVKGGGCSGLTLVLGLCDTRPEKDMVFEENGARIFVDPKSLLFLNGSVLDYIDDLMREEFKIINPNSKGSCGCGESFSV